MLCSNLPPCNLVPRVFVAYCTFWPDRWSKGKKTLGTRVAIRMILCLIVSDSTPLRFVDNQLLGLPSAEISRSFCLIYNICLLISVSTISTEVLTL